MRLEPGADHELSTSACERESWPGRRRRRLPRNSRVGCNASCDLPMGRQQHAEREPDSLLERCLWTRLAALRGSASRRLAVAEPAQVGDDVEVVRGLLFSHMP